MVIYRLDISHISSICSITQFAACFPRRILNISPSISKIYIPILSGNARISSKRLVLSCWNFRHCITRCIILSSWAKSQKGQSLAAVDDRFRRTSSAFSRDAWHTIFTIISHVAICRGNLPETYHQVRYLLPHPMFSRRSKLLCNLHSTCQYASSRSHAFSQTNCFHLFSLNHIPHFLI